MLNALRLIAAGERANFWVVRLDLREFIRPCPRLTAWIPIRHALGKM